MKLRSRVAHIGTRNNPTLCYAKDGAPEKLDAKARATRREGIEKVQVTILRGKGRCDQIGRVPTLRCAKQGAPEKRRAKAWATRHARVWGRSQPSLIDTIRQVHKTSLERRKIKKPKKSCPPSRSRNDRDPKFGKGGRYEGNGRSRSLVGRTAASLPSCVRAGGMTIVVDFRAVAHMPSIYKSDSFERKLELECFWAGGYTRGMNEQAGIATHAGPLLAPMPARSRGAIRPAWEPSSRHLSIKDSLTAGAFMILYMAAYLAAGFAGVTFMEWAWMRAFG